MKFFEGHPQTILIGASLLSNMSLIRLFEFYSEGVHHHEEDLALGQIAHDSDIPNHQKYFSKVGKMMKAHLLPDTIKKSLQYAVEIIKAQGMDYYKFLGVLSLFPGGVCLEDLNELYPKDEDLEDKL